jgi:hypothetical protein
MCVPLVILYPICFLLYNTVGCLCVFPLRFIFLTYYNCHHSYNHNCVLYMSWKNKFLFLFLWSRTLVSDKKNRPSQIYSPYSNASINVKTGSQDPADFAMTRPLIHWHTALWSPRYAKGRIIVAWTARAAKNGPQTFGSSCNKQNGKCWQFAQWLFNHWHTDRVICPRTLLDMPQSGK